MKRIVTLGAILTAFAVAPSVASAAYSPAVQKPAYKPQIAKVLRAQTAALTVQRHRVMISHAQRFAILNRALNG
jgi:hypothetical protein